MRRTLLRSLIMTVSSGLFTVVYNYFGHGISSWYMDYLFLPPLIGALLIPFVLCCICGLKKIPRLTAELWFAGVFTVEGYFLVRGILEIAMASSPYLPVYLWVAGALFLAAAGYWIFGKKKTSSGKKECGA